MSSKERFAVNCILIIFIQWMRSRNIFGAGIGSVPSESSNSRHCYRYNIALLEGGYDYNFIGTISVIGASCIPITIVYWNNSANVPLVTLLVRHAYSPWPFFFNFNPKNAGMSECFSVGGRQFVRFKTFPALSTQACQIWSRL